MVSRPKRTYCWERRRPACSERVARKVTSDDAGSYSVPFLPPGEYRLRISANGFEPKVFPDISVSITETTTRDATLAVAGLTTDAVSITAAPLLQTEGPQLGRIVD